MRCRLALALALGLTAAGGVADERAEQVGAFTWDIDAGWFGGFSGLTLDPTGTAMTAVSDRGHLIAARIQRAAGKITDIQLVDLRDILGPDGQLLSQHLVDSEGLARGPQGDLFLAMEFRNRVMALSETTGRITPLPGAAAFDTLPENRGLEALAADEDGRLYTAAEATPDDDAPMDLFRFDGQDWQVSHRLRTSPGFAPVGADFGPDGRFYLLERKLTVLGFASQIRSWRLTADSAQDEHTHLTTRPGKHDNLEGLAVWVDTSGQTRLTMISDDNFRFFQRTEIVEYTLQE